MGMIFLYILPFIVIVVTYGGIIWHLHTKTRNKKGPVSNIVDNTWARDLEEQGKMYSTLCDRLIKTLAEICFY